MFREIGGHFTSGPGSTGRVKDSDLALTCLPEGINAVYISSGRGAITRILEEIDLVNKKVLLPMYTCDSVIMPFREKGFDLIFIDIQPDLSVDPERFIELTSEENFGFVLLHSYFGFDTLSEVREKYKLLRENGIVVIEDITHSMLSSFDSSGADFYPGSIRKWLGIPDGAVLFSASYDIKHEEYPTNEILVEQNVKAMKMKSDYIRKMDPKLKAEFRKIFYSMEDLLDKDCSIYSMSEISKEILSQTDFTLISAKRRENFAFLLDNIADFDFIDPVFTSLPDDVTPLYFPIYVKGNRDKFQVFMAKQDIYMPIHWPIPDQCFPSLTVNSKYIYDHILSIPCDQRYGTQDMRRIVTIIDSYKIHI